MIKAILFDYGHTLVNFNKRSVKEVISRFNMTEEEYERRHKIYHIYSLGGFKSDEEYLKFASLFCGLKRPLPMEFLNAIQSIEKIHPKTVDLLYRLEKKYALGIVANNVKKWVEKKLEKYKIKKLFKAIVVSSELGIRKPDPRIFTYALKKLKVQPDECVFVSDELNEDLTGAKVLGIKTVWLKNQEHINEEKTFEPDFIINSLEDLENVLSELK